MGLTITANNSEIELSGGYSILMKIRTRVANAFDKEFGKLYNTLFEQPFFKDKDWYKEFDKKANEMLKNERFKKEDDDIVDFLFMSDCNGKVKSKTCGKIYNLIKDIEEPNLQLRYAVYSNNDWEDFKALLKSVIQKEEI